MKIKWKIIVFGPRKLRSVLINELGNAFITSRLDYCDSLFLGLPLSSIACWQIVQNAAASLLTRAKKTGHVTSILASLPWLPVHIRIQLKMLLFVFNGQARSYLTDRHTPLSSSRYLISSGRFFFAVPHSHLKTKCDRAFSVVPSIITFKMMLKTYLYSQAFELISSMFLLIYCFMVCLTCFMFSPSDSNQHFGRLCWDKCAI